MKYEMKFAVGLSAMPDAAALRQTIFVEEQGFQQEFDELDDTAIHCVLYADGEPVGTGRLYADAEQPHTVHLGRIAVRQTMRGQHLGARVVQTMEQYAAAHGFTYSVLSAQVRASGFYRSLGYREIGGIYYEEFCRHIRMEKALTAERNSSHGD